MLGKVHLTVDMGKIYLIPEKEETKGYTTVYLNFGTYSKGNQSFPLYSKMILENICTEIQYKKLCDEIITYLDNNTFSPFAAQLMCIGSLLILPMIYLCFHMQSLTKGIRTIVKNHTKEWSNCTNCTMEVIQKSYKVTNLQTGVGYHEDGTVMTRPEMVLRGSDMVPTGHREAAWPPIGYTIILKISDPTIRRKWPKLAIGQIPLQSHVMDREISISEELVRLEVKE